MTLRRTIAHRLARFFVIAGPACAAQAQTPPSGAEKSDYAGLLAAAARGGVAQIMALTARGGAPDVRDGGPRHTDTLRALVEAGANVSLPDRDGQTPLALARARGYDAMVKLLLPAMQDGRQK